MTQNTQRESQTRFTCQTTLQSEDAIAAREVSRRQETLQPGLARVWPRSSRKRHTPKKKKTGGALLGDRESPLLYASRNGYWSMESRTVLLTFVHAGFVREGWPSTSLDQFVATSWSGGARVAMLLQAHGESLAAGRRPFEKKISHRCPGLLGALVLRQCVLYMCAGQRQAEWQTHGGGRKTRRRAHLSSRGHFSLPSERRG